jgi:hypothetical protein
MISKNRVVIAFERSLKVFTINSDTSINVK